MTCDPVSETSARSRPSILPFSSVLAAPTSLTILSYSVALSDVGPVKTLPESSFTLPSAADLIAVSYPYVAPSVSVSPGAMLTTFAP